MLFVDNVTVPKALSIWNYIHVDLIRDRGWLGDELESLSCNSFLIGPVAMLTFCLVGRIHSQLLTECMRLLLKAHVVTTRFNSKSVVGWDHLHSGTF